MEYSQEYVSIVKYRNLREMEVWQTSVEHLQFLKRMEVMLESPIQQKFEKDRHIRDAFSELLVSHGGDAPSRPPPAWKVFMMVFTALVMTTWPINANLFPILGEDCVALWVVVMVVTILAVIICDYITLPPLMFHFNGWFSK